MISELISIPQVTASEPDINMPCKVNFDYFSVTDFRNYVDIDSSYLLKSFCFKFLNAKTSTQKNNINSPSPKLHANNISTCFVVIYNTY